MPRKKPSVTPTFDPSSLAIRDINVLGFTIENDPDNSRYPGEAEQYEFGVLTDVYSRKDYRLRVVITINCKVIFDEENSTDASFMSECVFDVNPKPGVSKRKHFALEQLHKVTRLSAISIAYSTTRGLMYSRTAGTILEGAILPIVDPINLDGFEADEAGHAPPKELRQKEGSE